MAELAQHIELVIRDKGPTTLYIDGEEFPWHVTSDDLELTSDMDGAPLLQVGILAQRITTRFENGPYEASPLPEEMNPNFSDSTAGAHPEGEWSVGWKFNISAEGPPPATVLALRVIGDEGKIPFLVRANEGNWNAWSWASGPFDPPNPDYTHLWRRLSELIAGQTCQVVRTKGD